MKYEKQIQEAKEVMKTLIHLMNGENDMKKFRHIAAVYIFWQHDLDKLQLETK